MRRHVGAIDTAFFLRPSVGVEVIVAMNTSIIVKGFKSLQIVPSLHRNFGVCSVLMINKAATDPIQKLFLDKLKEYNRLSSSQGGKLVDITSEKQKEYDETLSNLQKAYGADKADYSKFPTFTFTEPKLDPINLEEKSA